MSRTTENIAEMKVEEAMPETKPPDLPETLTWAVTEQPVPMKYTTGGDISYAVQPVGTASQFTDYLLMSTFRAATSLQAWFVHHAFLGHFTTIDEAVEFAEADYQKQRDAHHAR
jgi:hypothetical protein